MVTTKDRARQSERALNLLEFAERNIKIRGKPFSLPRHPYLEELYALAEQPKRLVCMKAAQVGVSTYNLVKAAWLAHTHGGKTLYLLPTEKMALRFGRDRLPSLLQTQRLASPALVPVGDGAIMFRGLLNDDGVRAQDADMLVLDELDCCRPDRVTLAQDRILASELGWISYLSTPTIPGYGVSKLFEASDRRTWFVTCPRCSWEGDLTAHFPDCLVNAGRVCPRCKTPLDITRGRWIAAGSGKGLIGYHIPHLITTLPAAEILRQYETAEDATAVQRFYNSVLGLPYVPPGSGLTDEDFARAWGNHDPATSARFSVVGVDVGDTIHALAASPREGVLTVIGIAELSSFREVTAFLRAYGAARCVIDAMPYKASAVDLARDFAGIVWLAYFAGTAWTLGVERTADGTVPKISLERTVAIDRMVGRLKEGGIILPRRRFPLVEKLVSHVKALTRGIEESRGGVLRPGWRSAGPDHFAMALTYLVAAAEITPATAPPPSFAEQRRF